MTMHLFGTVLTHQGVSHNNRGESEGTVSTLQKVIRDGEIFSTVSSEAIRYGLREIWQGQADLVPQLNRTVGHDGSSWVDKEFADPGKFIDNDVLGYMHAKQETASRRGILEISRAVSTTSWPGTISAHFASAGSNPSVASDNPIPYQAEVHDTRYQYTFAMTPDALLQEAYARTEKTLLALQNLRRVGGNHSRFLFDFAPEAVVLRWTTDPAPRIMFVFDQDDRGRISLTKLVNRVTGGDVGADEVIVGTALDGIGGLDKLKQAKISVHKGVKAAFADLLARVKG